MRVTEAARLLKVTPQTVRNWCNDGRLPYTLSAAGQRVFARHELLEFMRDGTVPNDESVIIFYVRSSSGSDISLDTQTQLLTEAFGAPHKVYQDKASGLSEKRRGLDAMLTYVAKCESPAQVCVTTADRLSRFGVTFLERLITEYGGQLVVAESAEAKEPQEVLMADFMSLLASFAGKFYRIRGWEQQRALASRAIAEVDARGKP